jgi:PhnB protein
MTTINPWINFNGNAEEAFIFYRSVFGGEFTTLTRFKDLAGPELQISENDANKIMRITLSINGTNTLTGNDVPEFMGKVSEIENRSKIYVSVDSKEEAQKIFDGLSGSGQIEVPINENDEGTCSAMFRDQYGIEWIVEFSPKK